MRRFVLFLARTVFHCTRDEALDRLSAYDIAEWQAEYKLAPWGEFREDVQSAVVAHTMARIWTKQPGNLMDYVIPFGREPESDGNRELQKFKAFCALSGIKITRKAAD